MKKAQIGDTVRIHFTASQGNGAKIATTRDEEPMDLTIGEKKLIKCFEQAIIGMAVGERKTVEIEPNKAMGGRKPELVNTFPRIAIPEKHEDLRIGSKVELKDDSGKACVGTVTQLTNQEVKVDANHPLAGKALIFDIELINFV